MLNMKKDILCYLVLLISFVLFICTYVFLEPIPLLIDELDYDKLPEIVEVADIHEFGLEKREKIQEKYIGTLNLNSKWTNFILIFTNYKDEFIEEYERYNTVESNQEKTEYENKTYVRYGINTQEDRDKLYQKFKNISNIQKIEVIEETINILEEGISFDIKAIDENSKEETFNCIIFNTYIDEIVFMKIVTHVPLQDIIEGE